MKFYIVTPSYNSLQWLQGCIRSVADQVGGGVEVHHHVQDGGSTDGTQEWIALWKQQHSGVTGYTFSFECVSDKGMYDAINKAWEKMPKDADITAHLNSDEQYMPNALKSISEKMEAHPEADIAISTYIVVDAEGGYICHRRPICPRIWSSKTVCEIVTCACFHRVKPFLEHGIRFDTRWRSIADVIFFRDIVKSRPKFLLLPELLSGTFAVTGHNLAWSEITRHEWREMIEELPRASEYLHQFAYRWCNLCRYIKDWLCKKPVEYSIYLKGDERYSTFDIITPTSLWGIGK